MFPSALPPVSLPPMPFAPHADLGDALLYEIRICRSSQDSFLVLVTDRKGAIKFASPQLTTILCPRGGNTNGLSSQMNGESDAFKDRIDLGHKGAGHGLSILSGVAASHGLIGSYNLRDFLPHPWKDIHVKLLRVGWRRGEGEDGVGRKGGEPPWGVEGRELGFVCVYACMCGLG